ncbi:hypothetical protein Kpol_534p59 [Vanderwaltozyma polyspora DSM 70294]|uniref:FAS1 domain-containing protein n=1 Tax=Vanderwaltozyma polyspora (strain ATCC 22028 / DSM 70294 / BCRC 21397 / CBS 2163 / NBRC 10782 / NRRL Y-8283 / UCD 57-17) TaxID=436907 RepID=A7TJN4_VANPO|nr:uncharacterized protein Kpol_534p59 [Vanderwaltozyma polyspora DSM 70294]EDO17577.1 hypothetical protein Kpol_534p59 [Vanderwaltozyma polyspora DSM 70294]
MLTSSTFEFRKNYSSPSSIYYYSFFLLQFFLLNLTLANHNIIDVQNKNDIGNNDLINIDDEKDIRNIREPDFPFTTVIDLLSQNVQFSSFLRLIQLNGYVPYLNELTNFTLFAPVNSAFIDYNFESNDNFTIEDYVLYDKVLDINENNEQNDNLKSYINIIYNGLNKAPFVFGRNIKDDLNTNKVKEPNDKYYINNVDVVEENLKPNFQNAIIQGISATLKDKPNLKELLELLSSNYKYNEKFELFTKFIDSNFEKEDFEGLLGNNTILLPNDNNLLNTFNKIEINYIIDAFNSLDNLVSDSVSSKIKDIWLRDRLTFLKSIILKGIVGGKISNSKVKKVEVQNLNEDQFNITSDETGTRMRIFHGKKDATSLYSNILYNKGILHTFDDLHYISNSVLFNTEKYLHGLNNSEFVRELYFRNLEHLIQEDHLKKNMTLFIPENSENDAVFGFTKASLLYHFTDSQLWLEDEFKESSNSVTKLYDSSFCSSNKRLGGNCQRFKITKSKSGYQINDKFKILNSKPYQIGNNLIYKISDDLHLPGDLIVSINPFYHCSNSLVFLRHLRLLELAPNNEGYTVFLPCFNSWDSQELNLEFIEKNRNIQELIMRSLILNGLVYTDAPKENKNSMQDLLGKECSVTLRSQELPGSKSVNVNISTFPMELTLEKDMDIFFNQGVIHPLRDVYLPSAVEISAKDLIKTTGNQEFLKLLDHFNDLAGIVDNDEPFSLLIPTLESLLYEGISGNYTRLEDFLKLHIIPGNSTKNLLQCNGGISTQLGQLLSCSELSPKNYLLRIQNGSDNEVRILKKGCSTKNPDSCIFMIDRPMSLSWISKEKYHLDLPAVAIGIGIVLGALFILSLLGFLLAFVGKSHKDICSSQNIDNSENDTGGNVTDPLLPRNRDNGGNLPTDGRPFESSYSSNSVRSPIRVISNKCSKPDLSIYNNVSSNNI